MEGISRTACVGPPITLGGRQFTVSGRILRHYAEIEAAIIASRGNPFDLIRQMGEAMPERQDLAIVVATQLFEQAKAWRFVTLGDIGEWLQNTVRGRCFRTWLAIRNETTREPTLDEVTVMYSDEYERILNMEGYEAAEKWDATITDAINQASGKDDELGNSTGSPPEGMAANVPESPGT